MRGHELRVREVVLFGSIALLKASLYRQIIIELGFAAVAAGRRIFATFAISETAQNRRD
jgi:hypothetical protein